MWCIKLKVTNEQTRKTKIHRHRQQLGWGRGVVGVVKGKGGQILNQSGGDDLTLVVGTTKLYEDHVS